MATDCNADESHKTNDSNSSSSSSSSSHEITVIVLSGLPASGKSTVARKLRERFNRCNDGSGVARHREGIQCNAADSHRLIHIEYDDLEDALLRAPEETIRTTAAKDDDDDDDDDDNDDNDDDDTNEQRRDAWNRARRTAVEQMEREIQAAIKTREEDRRPSSLSSEDPASLVGDKKKKGTVILMDDNFHLRGMRKQIHRRLLGYRPISMIRFAILYVDTPLEVCLERNRNRSGRRRVPDDVIVKMSSVLEPPRAAWEIDSTMTIVNNDSTSSEAALGESESELELEVEQILEFIQGCPEIVELPPDPEASIQAEAEAEADRIQTRQSQVHALDKLLRSFVGRVARFDKTYAKAANSARKELMEDFKTGRIHFAAVDNNNNDNNNDNNNRDGCVASAFLDRVVPMDTATATMSTTGNGTQTEDDPSLRRTHKITPRSQLAEHLSRLTV